MCSDVNTTKDNISFSFEDEDIERLEELENRVNQLEHQQTKQFYENQETERVLSEIFQRLYKVEERAEEAHSHLFVLEEEELDNCKNDVEDLEKENKKLTKEVNKLRKELSKKNRLIWKAIERIEEGGSKND